MYKKMIVSVLILPLIIKPYDQKIVNDIGIEMESKELSIEMAWEKADEALSNIVTDIKDLDAKKKIIKEVNEFQRKLTEALKNNEDLESILSIEFYVENYNFELELQMLKYMVIRYCVESNELALLHTQYAEELKK